MENSNIAWTNHTFNPWEGCTKVSPGCLNCYAENRNKRFAGGANWGKGAPRRRTSASNWREPIKWNKTETEKGQLFGNIPWARGALDQASQRPRVFCASLADWLDDEVEISWLADLLELVRTTPNLDWLLLTKRPENWRERLDKVYNHCAMQVASYNPSLQLWTLKWLQGDAPANVWLGTSVEDQPRAKLRVMQVLQIPARIRFLSCEPLLEEVDLRDLPNENFGEGEHRYDSLGGRAYENDGSGTNGPRIHWVIVGGESGSEARPFSAEWARSLRDQCKAAGVAFFMKQLGSSSGQTWSGGAAGHGAPLKILDKKGGDPSEWPEDLRIQDFPA